MDTIAEQIQQALDQATIQPCTMCQRPAAGGAGLFVPNDPTVYGGVPEKTRYIVYALCATCRENYANVIIEAVLQRRLVDGAVH